MPALTWDKVLENKALLIGGEIESQEDGVFYRGPIKDIVDSGGSISIQAPWMARSKTMGADWENWHITQLETSKLVSQPHDIGDGRIFVQMPFLGGFTIFPKTGSKLDPAKVKGLPKASERFLALYPDLKFDRKVAEQVLVDQSFSRAYASFVEKPENATLQDLLACFAHDSSAEEFLWRYVEAVVGEKEPHHKVY